MANAIPVHVSEARVPSARAALKPCPEGSDWPEPGPIDLAVHDLPHASSTLEWWYVNSHLELNDGRRVAVFAAFFRQLASETGAGEREYTHSVAWGLSLVAEGRFLSKVAVDQRAPEVGLRKLESGVKHDDPRLERALAEVLRQGKMPGPTQLFHTAPRVSQETLGLDYDGDCFEKCSDGRYRLAVSDVASGVACELTFTLQKPPTRHGDDGVVHGVTGESMFYYFVPRAAVTGRVRLDDRWHGIARGTGWYDHEFGHTPRSASEAPSTARRGETCWRWLALQLEDGVDVSVYFITRRETGEILDNWTVCSDARGRSAVYRDATLEVVDCWRSTRTFVEYPIWMRLSVPSAGLELDISPAFPDQEVITVISDPSFWEGSVTATGDWRGTRAAGRGWLECKGFGHANLDSFQRAVSREVHARLADVLPLVPSREVAASWVARGSGALSPALAIDVDIHRLAASLVAPIRTISDRGGKAWRPFAALACINVVGGDSRRFLHWLVMPEIVHVGSLIVDDVEDGSAVRRGGPASHLLHGTPAAINAGTAAYFLAEPPVDKDDLPPTVKLQLYRLFFDAMRAGHAGQALDLADVSDLADMAAASGKAGALTRHVMTVHRLKTAIPAAMFARAGAILGGGTRSQVERLGAYFEAVGLAFQIIDDVRDVRGFERDLKQRGEDITLGKLTLPVVKAFERLSPAARSRLWRTLASRPSDRGQVEDIAQLLEECGALEACCSEARELVENAWTKLAPVIDDSQYKLMLRAFGWYVLERHY